MIFLCFYFVTSLFFILLHPEMEIRHKTTYIIILLLSISFVSIAQGSGNPPPPMPPPPPGLPIDGGIFAIVSVVFGMFYAGKKLKK